MAKEGTCEQVLVDRLAVRLGDQHGGWLRWEYRRVGTRPTRLPGKALRPAKHTMQFQTLGACDRLRSAQTHLHASENAKHDRMHRVLDGRRRGAVGRLVCKGVRFASKSSTGRYRAVSHQAIEHIAHLALRMTPQVVARRETQCVSRLAFRRTTKPYFGGQGACCRNRRGVAQACSGTEQQRLSRCICSFSCPDMVLSLLPKA